MTNKKPVTLICVQPACLYYAWQIEVMLTNFEELGIHKEHNIHCLFAYNKEEKNWLHELENFTKLMFRFSKVANFYFYEDKRQYPISYISSIRPNLLKQHLQAHTWLSQQSIFYHDCDIIFSKYPDFLMKYHESEGNNWFVSDTISYIGYDYIVSKGHDVLDKMCQIVGCHPYLIKEKQSQSGGAQYFMKGVDYQFFDKMEKDCENLFKEITELNNRKKLVDPTHHELQIWCADMWAIIWGAWMRGYDTIVSSDLNFCWATDDVSKYDESYIFHNAGVTASGKGCFYKGNFRFSLPYDTPWDEVDKGKASYKYFELLKTLYTKTCLK